MRPSLSVGVYFVSWSRGLPELWRMPITVRLMFVWNWKRCDD
jgi:hypothetical protein